MYVSKTNRQNYLASMNTIPSYMSKIRIYMLLDGKICQQPRKGSDKTENSFIMIVN